MPPKTPRKPRGEIPSTPKTGLRNLTSPPISSRLRSRLRKNENPIEEPSSPSKESRTPLPRGKLNLAEAEPQTPAARSSRNASESRAKTQPVARVSKVAEASAATPKTTLRPRGRLPKEKQEQPVDDQTVNAAESEQTEIASQNEEPEQSTPSTPQLTSPPLVKRLRSRARKTEPRPTIAEPLSAKTPATSRRGRKAATLETPAPVTRAQKEEMPKRNLISDLVQSQEESDENKEDEISIVATLGDNRSIPLDVKSPFKPGTPEAKPFKSAERARQSPLFNDEFNSPLGPKGDAILEDDILIQRTTSTSVKIGAGSNQTTPQSVRKDITTTTVRSSLEDAEMKITEEVTVSQESVQNDTVISGTSDIGSPESTTQEQDATKATTPEPESPKAASKQTTPKSNSTGTHQIFDEQPDNESDEEMEDVAQNAPTSDVGEYAQPSEPENSDSDDDAPEAISMSTGKSSALEAKRQEREAAQLLAEQQKSKRREVDTKLKKQKAAKKDRMSQKKLPEIEFEPEEEAEPLEIPTTLPLEMLEMVADMDATKPAEKKPVKHGKHTRLDDLEELEETSRKQKRVKGEKNIGNIKVVSLTNQAKSKPVPESISDFKSQHFYGDRVKRKDAVLNMSQKRKVAMKFRRS
ncbi:hypothetical protein K493DRAFT_82887 [Basidiobolus meristosporus CBS 931.73]|uniref:Uncharacterized protein n=1 Tax=Basidiobolus meristosporus CBS 931.73 TaxID=1314790 RepID=A0A1Y1XLR6_9FUNG|nr:hypothetical protein K493DRAFT_82887 [Basidiobolus meristosporus CBS 931.73]|eukprot:ORX86635.1 hypothetical protein K493DRAFT_82887 [Basidiobolus meristosporus CBS 931.73]